MPFKVVALMQFFQQALIIIIIIIGISNVS